MGSGIRVILLMLLSMASTAVPGCESAAFLTSPPGANVSTVFIDARPLADCAARTLARGKCLPAGEVFGNDGQPPEFRDLLWLLGTAGLDGSESVVVVGDDEASRNALAGLLWLAGQRHVSVLVVPIRDLLSEGRMDTAAGETRSMVRIKIWNPLVRDKAIVLSGELASVISSGGTVVHGAHGREAAASLWRLVAGECRTDARVFLGNRDEWQRSTGLPETEGWARTAGPVLLLAGLAAMLGAWRLKKRKKL